MDFDDLQRQGWSWLTETANRRIHATTRQPPQARFAEERDALLSLPAEPFDTDWVLYPKISKDCVIRVDTNDDSVPWQYARKPLEVRVDGRWVRVLSQGQEVARHPRSYARHQQCLNRSHYHGLWQSRAEASFAALEKGFLEAYGQAGQHFYAGLSRKTERLKAALEAIMRLERRYPHQDIQAALEIAVQQRTFDAAAVQYLLHTARIVSPQRSVTPTPLDMPVEERALETYDQLLGVRP